MTVDGIANRYGMHVVVQDRSILFRESLRLVLESTSEFEVVAMASDEAALLEACEDRAVGAIIFEVAGVSSELQKLGSELEARIPGVVLVGVVPNGAAMRTQGAIACLPRTAAPEAFLAALRRDHRLDSTEVRKGEQYGLTDRELQVLALISRGMTTMEIAARLGLSAKTIESRRQSLFAKLKVQNQAHAVAVAMRGGLLGGVTRV